MTLHSLLSSTPPQVIIVAGYIMSTMGKPMFALTGAILATLGAPAAGTWVFITKVREGGGRGGRGGGGSVAPSSIDDAPSPFHPPLFQLLDRLSKGVRDAPTNALLADIAGPKPKPGEKGKSNAAYGLNQSLGRCARLKECIRAPRAVSGNIKRNGVRASATRRTA